MSIQNGINKLDGVSSRLGSFDEAMLNTLSGVGFFILTEAVSYQGADSSAEGLFIEFVNVWPLLQHLRS